MARLFALLLLALWAIASCQAPGPSPTVAAPSRYVGQLVGEDYVVAGDVGVLRLTVHWPTRRTAIIPSDTSTLAIKVLDGTDVVAFQEVSRPTGQATQSIRIVLRPVTNATVEIKAYREAKPVPETAEHTALGVAAGVNIVRSQVSAVDIELGSVSAPAITKLSANVGKVGDTLTLTGANLGGTGQQVTFNGTPAQTVTPVSSTALQAVIPAGATVGPLRVTIGNQTSTSQVNFWVVSGVTIDAAKASWDTSAATSRLVLAGTQLAFSATTGWSLKSGGTLEQFGAAPAAAWSGSDPAAGTLDGASGVFVAADSSATTTVTAKVGPVASNALTITGVRITGVTLNQTSATLNLPAPNGYVSAGLPSTVQLTAQVSNSSSLAISGVTWSSSAVGVAKTSSAGLVTAVGTGSATITATAIDDSRVEATASVVVKALGVVKLGAK
jgi:hypothetical protein